MPNCAILSCKNSTKYNRNVAPDKGSVSFHRFPNNPELKEKWIEATGQKNWFPSKHSRICSIHFKEDCFNQTEKFRRLTAQAMPTIEILRMSKSENTEEKLTDTSPYNMLTTVKIEKDIDQQQPSTSNVDAQTKHQDKKIEHKLNKVQQKNKQQNLQIKRLRESNRRKDIKIRNLLSLLMSFKKKYVNLLLRRNIVDFNATTKEPQIN